MILRSQRIFLSPLTKAEAIVRLRSALRAEAAIAKEDPAKYTGHVTDDGFFSCRPRHVHLLPRVETRGVLEEAESGSRILVYTGSYAIAGPLAMAFVGVPVVFFERFSAMVENPSFSGVSKGITFLLFCTVVLSTPLLLEYFVDKRRNLNFLREILQMNKRLS